MMAYYIKLKIKKEPTMHDTCKYNGSVGCINHAATKSLMNKCDDCTVPKRLDADSAPINIIPKRANDA